MKDKYSSFIIIAIMAISIASCLYTSTNKETKPATVTIQSNYVTPSPSLTLMHLDLIKPELLSGILIVGPTNSGKIFKIDLDAETIAIFDIPIECREPLAGTKVLCKDQDGFYIYNWENESIVKLPQIPENVAFYSEYSHNNLFITSSGNAIYYYTKENSGFINLFAIIPPETTPKLITNRLPSGFIAYESLSNDFKYIAGINETDNVYEHQIFDVNNDNSILVTNEYQNGVGQNIQWAPKNNIVIYFLGEGSYRESLPCYTSFLTYDVSTSILKYVTHPEQFSCYSIVFGSPIIWSVDGSRIAITDLDENWLCIIDPTTRQQSCYPNELAHQMSWSPDGRYIISIKRNNTLVAFSVNTGEYITLADLSELNLYSAPIQWIDTSE